MAGALLLAALTELCDFFLELRLLPRKVPLVRNDEFLRRGITFCKRLFVGVNGLHEGSNQPANEDAWQVRLSGSHVERSGTVRHHLGDIHLAPLPLRGWLQLVDTGDHFVYEDAWQVRLSGSHVERSGTVRHHLGDIHLAPLPLRGWLQLVDTGDHFVD